MDLKDITDLITIRQYVANQINNPVIDRPMVSYMNDLLLLTDKKIAGLLAGEEFKGYINYDSYKQARKEAAENSHVKSSLIKRS